MLSSSHYVAFGQRLCQTKYANVNLVPLFLPNLKWELVDKSNFWNLQTLPFTSDVCSFINSHGAGLICKKTPQKTWETFFLGFTLHNVWLLQTEGLLFMIKKKKKNASTVTIQAPFETTHHNKTCTQCVSRIHCTSAKQSCTARLPACRRQIYITRRDNQT